MQQISKSSVKNYILSLKNPEEGFILQKKYNQNTIMSSAFSILTLELVDCLNNLDIKAEASHISSYQDRSSGLIIDPKLNFDNSNLEDLEKNYIHYQTTAFSLSALDAKIDDIVKIGWMADKVMAFEETGQSLPTKSKS